MSMHRLFPAAAALLLASGLALQTRFAASRTDGITADLRGAPLEDALAVAMEGAGRTLDISPRAARAARPVTLRLNGVEPAEAARRIARAAGTDARVDAKTVSVGTQEPGLDLTPPVLETRLLGQTKLLPNAEAALRIVTVRHADNSPIAGADVLLALSQNAEPGPKGHPGFARALFRGRTDASGTLNATYRMPALPAGAYRLSVTSAALGERDRIVETVSLAPETQILLTTDKPVYQPSQTIHMRALALSLPNRAPVAGAPALFEAADGKGNKVFKRRVTTDDYGIAAADFVLADEVNMGAYRLSLHVGDAAQEKTVTVDRYALPKFKVSFTPDRKWYLPGQTLTGVVSAQYFFGKPVQGGVKVALSTFDAGFQQFGEVTGTLDASGHFRVEQKLPEFFAGLPLEQGNAFVKAETVVTDTADHEEKASVSVPVAKDGLKVTLIPESPSALPGVASRVYIVTSYPDGSPAPAEYRASQPNGFTSPRPLTGRTDASGIAVAEFTPTASAPNVQVTAVDANGNAGMASMALNTGQAGVILRADRALYRAGDTMLLTAFSTEGRATMYFDILRNGQTVLTKSAELDKGRASASVSLGEDLTGTLEVHAYRIGRDGEIRRDTRVVYVDPANDLKVAVTPNHESYAPGERASVRFAVTGPDGRPRPSALGISIVDESVFALQEMQPGFEKVYFLLEKEILEPRAEIHGVSGDDIVRPLPAGREGDGRQRAAGALFAALPRHDDRVVSLANSYQQKIAALQQRAWGRFAGDVDAIWAAMERYKRARGNMPPVAGDALDHLLRGGFLTAKQTRDPWGRRYRLTANSNTYEYGFNVASSGPDGVAGSSDDLSTWAGPGFRNQQHWAMRGGLALGGRAGDELNRVEAMPEGAVRFRELGMADKLAFSAAMPAPAEAPNASAPGNPAPARVREYFPETLLFQPALITDANGIATLDVPMADSITTWRLTAMASSRTGALGSVTAPMRAFQDFFVDINFPVQLTQGDEVSVPVSVYNYLPTAQTVTLTADKEGWFDLLDEPTKTVSLGPNEVKGVRFRVKVTGLGFQKLTVRAKGGNRADAVRREVEVIPNGKRVEQVFNGRLTGAVHQTVRLPETAVPGASNILVKVYPGLFSSVLEGMDKVFRMPFGCFEQTSSVTYPNVLVLDYMKRTKRITPEIQMKAEQYVNLGYQRLVSYEVPGGGFSWFGSAPANKVLTAYGLQEFAAMSQVWDVDAAMIARTRAWEASQQNADGSWSPDANYIDEGLGPMWKSNLLSTAYVAWGMAESGRGAGTGDNAATAKAMNYLRAHADEAKDPYSMAVLANAMLAAAPDDPAAKAVVARLLAARTDETPELAFWKTSQSTVTFAGGDSANVEATALAAYALIRAGQAPDVVGHALNWIIKQRDPSGTWGSTQATVLALKVLVASLSAQMQKGNATVRVLVNGAEAGVIHVTPDNADVMQQVDAKQFVRPGDNDVALEVTGEGQMMYGISAWHYDQWAAAGAEKGPLDIGVKYDRTRLAKDETLTAQVSIRYTPPVVELGRPMMTPAPRALNMVVVDLGIPPGFAVEPEDLKALVDAKTVARFETTGRQVILYFEKIEANQPVEFSVRMRAQYPMRAQTPQSVAYQYYDPSVRSTAAPVSLEVTE
ncbi:MAG TPA: alpha-2-macroglobulin family protein [Armatimonadota bacterium]|jgi:uncharacterized protein YfaS (alpha-2-macroglobulin family)